MVTEPQNLPNRHNTPKNRESSYLHAYKAPLHLSRILYKSTFLCKTNPILSAVGGLQMNVNLYNTRDYENISDWTLGESKPNSNPTNPISVKKCQKCPALIVLYTSNTPPAARTKWLAIVGTFNYCFEKVKAPVKPVAKYRIGE